MAYVTQQDLVDRFGDLELTQVTGGSGSPDATKVAKAIADAQSKVDSYLGARYDVPLDPVPEGVAAATADLARFELHASRATEEVRNRYKDAIAWLRDIADGRAQLDAAGTTVEEADGAAISVSAPAQIFTKSTVGLMP